VVELYSACRCLYYQHAVDRCPKYGRHGHSITHRTILVGYACADHSSRPGDYDDGPPSAHTQQSNTARRPKLQLAKKTRPKKQKVDQISQNATVNSPSRQAIAKGKTPPHLKQEPTRVQENKETVEIRTSEPPAATGTVSEDLLPSSHINNADRNKIHSQYDDRLSESIGSDESSSDETVASETGTIISIASSTTTVDIDATETIFRRLLHYQDLRYLWPQLVLRCASKRTSVLTIERFLRRYSEDLGKLAASTENSKDSESLVCLTASRFVRRSRLNIAHRICEAYHEAMDDYEQADEDLRERKEETTTEMTGNPDDMDVIYEISESFLFETEPIVALQSSVKAFVISQDPTVDDIGFGIYRSAEIYFSNIVSSIYEPPLRTGSQRLRWKCVSFPYFSAPK
jgi:hypothetical protein